MAKPPSGPDDVLVGSGSFRIDPNRALEVLRSRQVEADENRMAFWIRAAVLRRAPRADDPLLELDASLKTVVEGERYHAALKAVEEAAAAHSLALLARHERAMRLVGKLLLWDYDLLRVWKRSRRSSLAVLTSCFEWERRRGRLRRLLGGKLSGDRLRVLECAMVCGHLRGPADYVSGVPKSRRGGPLIEALLRLPLYFDCEGNPLSGKELKELHVTDKRPPF